MKVAGDVVQVLEALGAGWLMQLSWPWDFRGRRRVVKLKRSRRPWE